jgi:hypothetical protein
VRPIYTALVGLKELLSGLQIDKASNACAHACGTADITSQILELVESVASTDVVVRDRHEPWNLLEQVVTHSRVLSYHYDQSYSYVTVIGPPRRCCVDVTLLCVLACAVVIILSRDLCALYTNCLIIPPRDWHREQQGVLLSCHGSLLVKNHSACWWSILTRSPEVLVTTTCCLRCVHSLLGVSPLNSKKSFAGFLGAMSERLAGIACSDVHINTSTTTSLVVGGKREHGQREPSRPVTHLLPFFICVELNDKTYCGDGFVKAWSFVCVLEISYLRRMSECCTAAGSALVASSSRVLGLPPADALQRGGVSDEVRWPK